MLTIPPLCGTRYTKCQGADAPSRTPSGKNRLNQGMKFAINFSHPARQLVEWGELSLDLWKCMPLPEVLAEAIHRPCYVHLPHDVGVPVFASAAPGSEGDWEQQHRLVEQTQTPWINVHLNARREWFTESESVEDRFVRNIGLLAARYGAHRICAENVVYRGESGAYRRESVEPEVIHRTLERTGASFLLDTAHARLSADELGIDPWTYIQSLPVDRLVELHVTGTDLHDGIWKDSMIMSETDWELAERALAEIHAGRWARPWVVAFEYGGIGDKFAWRSDPDVIREQGRSLWNLVKEGA